MPSASVDVVSLLILYFSKFLEANYVFISLSSRYANGDISISLLDCEKSEGVHILVTRTKLVLDNNHKRKRGRVLDYIC